MFKRNNAKKIGKGVDYTEIFDYIVRNIDSFSDKAGELLNDDDLMKLCLNLLIPVARNGFANEERKLKLFYEAEKMGVHILPTHFYSPTPTTTELLNLDWVQGLAEKPINFERDICYNLLDEFKKYKLELKDIPLKSNEGDFYWDNPAMDAADASLYYYMIRHYKPKHVIEIGSGYSTLLAAKAAAKNEETTFEAIEPYPMDFLKKDIIGLKKLIPQKIQEVPFDVFDKLEANDILFVDNSHVCKTGSDVNHIILKLLSRLREGVIIHFHDIFLPYEMPQNWVMNKAIFWNEQYLLQALLLGGKTYKTLLPVHWLGMNMEEKLKEIILPEMEKYSGGSYWIQKMK